MIGRLTGKVIENDDDFVLVVDVNGVGYDVHAPLGTAGRARTVDGKTTFYVHTHVREDVLALYGFANADDRHAFRLLLSVGSIGPKSAISILSVLPAGELAIAIGRQEIKTLTAISGVGKKTAERILLELDGKISAPLDASFVAPAAKGAARNAKPKGPAFSGQALALHAALVNLGYKPPEAERAVTALGDLEAEEDLASLLRRALGTLSK